MALKRPWLVAILPMWLMWVAACPKPTPTPTSGPTTHEAVSTGQAEGTCGTVTNVVRTGSGAGECVSTRDAAGTVRHIHCDDKKGNAADWTCEGTTPACHGRGLGTCK
jgi:hypothetical protein